MIEVSLLFLATGIVRELDLEKLYCWDWETFIMVDVRGRPSLDPTPHMVSGLPSPRYTEVSSWCGVARTKILEKCHLSHDPTWAFNSNFKVLREI